MTKLHKLNVDFNSREDFAARNRPEFGKSIRVSEHFLKKETYSAFLWRIRIGQGDHDQLPPLLTVHDGGRR